MKKLTIGSKRKGFGILILLFYAVLLISTSCSYYFINESNYKTIVLFHIFAILMGFSPIILTLMAILIKKAKSKQKDIITISVLSSIVCIIVLILVVSLKGNIISLIQEPIHYQGICGLVYAKGPNRIRIDGVNYREFKGYYYDLLEKDQNSFRCYSNKPCTCNSEIDATVIPGINIVLNLKKT